MKCPGQDTRYWKSGDIYEEKCPGCGQVLEFFKDDSSRKCKNCGKRVLNPKIDFGCAAYCEHADQCLKELPPEILAERSNLLKDRVALEMKKYFANDFKRISHACNVARYAEQIVKREKGDMSVVLISAYLHDIGIKEAERKYQSSAAKYQEELGPDIARGILEGLGADQKLIDEVCDIVGHHHSPGPEETDNFKALYDADLIVNLEENSKEKPLGEEKIKSIIEKSFLTEYGRKVVQDVFLSKE